MELSVATLITSFFAGLITFLAPCTLPLVPAYLGFIGGVSSEDKNNPDKVKEVREKVFRNGLFFITGFSFVFIVFGALFGSLVEILQALNIGPTSLEGEVVLRARLGQLGGLLVILFGVFMLGALRIPFLERERKIKLPTFLEIGRPATSLLIGGAFAFGWTPCVGPVLGSILLLASTNGSILSGAILLSVFSLGLAVPFLLVALGFTHATTRIQNLITLLSKHRVSILGVLGFIFGLLLNLVVVSMFQKIDVTIGDMLLGSIFALLIPTVSALLLAFIAKRDVSIDVLSVGGGLFLIALGSLLALGSFGLLVQYGFVLLGSGFEELLITHL